jgi:valyl-tRNA synthetase
MIVDFLQQEGRIQSVKEDHDMVLTVCSKTGDVIEPMLIPQW